MPLRPVRVAGGLRLWLATFFIACVRERSGAGSGLAFRARGRRPAAALISSVMDSPASSMSCSCVAAVARPERFEERGDLFCRRPIPLGLRNAATALQTPAELGQLAQPLRRHLQLEAAGIAQALPDDGVLVPARGHRIEDDDRLAA